MGIREFNPLLEDQQDSSLQRLAAQGAETSYRRERALERLEERKEELVEENKDSPQEEWLLKPTALASQTR